jgi:hypothetical protein
MDISKVHFGGGDVLINLIDSSYDNITLFTTLGATEKEFGGALKLSDARIKRVFTENDKDEAAMEWNEGRDIYFEAMLVEFSVQNLALASGLHPTTDVSSDASYEWVNVIGNETIRRYPFIVKIPQFEKPGKYFYLTMPSCEITSAIEAQFKDEEVAQLRLTLKLHKAIVGAIVGKKYQFKRDK